MMQLHDLDVRHLKDIPGYKAILKAVIKSQIQQLVEQLADHTGEESILLTASVSDGTLSNMGSVTGKTFLDGRDEIKSQFLRHCLKKSQKKKQHEEEEIIEPDPSTDTYDTGGRRSSYESRVHQSPQQSHSTPHQSRVHPVALTKVSHGAPYSEGRGRMNIPGESHKRTFPSSSPIRPDHHSPLKQGRMVSLPSESSFPDISLSPSQHNPSTSGASSGMNIQKIDLSEHNVKIEDPNSSYTEILDTSSRESGPKDRLAAVGGASETSHSQSEQSYAEPSPSDRQAIETEISKLISSIPSTSESNTGDPANVKIEPITEGEMELEITGVEMAGNSESFSGDGTWAPNVSNRLGYSSASGVDTEAGTSQGGNQSGAGYTQQWMFSRTGLSAWEGPKAQRNQWHEFWLEKKGVYCCDFCGKSFLLLGHFKDHRRVHTGEKPWQCHLCGHRFIQKSNLKVHLARSKGRVPVKCPRCKQEVVGHCQLEKHIKECCFKVCEQK